MNHLQCNSREHRLLDCGFDNITDGHDEDWGVSCRNGNNILCLCYECVHTLIYLLSSSFSN